MLACVKKTLILTATPFYAIFPTCSLRAGGRGSHPTSQCASLVCRVCTPVASAVPDFPVSRVAARLRAARVCGIEIWRFRNPIADRTSKRFPKARVCHVSAGTIRYRYDIDGWDRGRLRTDDGVWTDARQFMLCGVHEARHGVT